MVLSEKRASIRSGYLRYDVLVQIFAYLSNLHQCKSFIAFVVFDNVANVLYSPSISSLFLKHVFKHVNSRLLFHSSINHGTTPGTSCGIHKNRLCSLEYT